MIKSDYFKAVDINTLNQTLFNYSEYYFYILPEIPKNSQNFEHLKLHFRERKLCETSYKTCSSFSLSEFCVTKFAAAIDFYIYPTVNFFLKKKTTTTDQTEG